MNPPTCKTCGKRTDLHDMHGEYRCSACRRELYPEVFGDARPWLSEIPLRLGSLCTGYGGLDLAVHEVLGGRMVWLSEIDPAPAQVCAKRFPGVNNLGDLSILDWQQVPPVDVLTAGYPCQPFSHAGKREGTSDERHLWPHIADAIRVLRPGLVVLENVSGHLDLGFDVVLGDLAALGFDAEWTLLRASDVGACHQRARLFILAADPGGSGAWGNPGGAPRAQEQDRRGQPHKGHPSEHLRENAPHADGGRLEVSGEHDGGQGEPGFKPSRRGDTDGLREAHGDTNSEGLEGRPADQRRAGEWTAGPSGVDAWGDYGPAIERHARVLGRPAPAPVDDLGRLSARFVEWMMMLPDGWVTDVLPSRTKALKCLGNGVVPPQAMYALRGLLARLDEKIAA